MKRRMLMIPIGMLALLTLGLLGACGDDDDGGVTLPPPQARTIKLAAYELKGGTNVEKEAFPGGELSGGYAIKAPNDEGRWEVEDYIWLPNQLTINEGDTVTLEIFGVNGARHDSQIEGYVDSFLVERGKLTSVTFTADKAGVFKLICSTHPESMIGEIVVLGRGS